MALWLLSIIKILTIKKSNLLLIVSHRKKKLLRTRLVPKRKYKKKICNKLTKNMQYHRIIYKISLICRWKKDFTILTKSRHPAQVHSQRRQEPKVWFLINATQMTERVSNPWSATLTQIGFRERFNSSSNNSKCQVLLHSKRINHESF